MVERLITMERAGSVRCSVHLVPWGKNKPNISAMNRMKFRFRSRFLIALIPALLGVDLPFCARISHRQLPHCTRKYTWLQKFCYGTWLLVDTDQVQVQPLNSRPLPFFPPPAGASSLPLPLLNHFCVVTPTLLEKT